jgi:membrane-bound metal-dependent hydrolase YbcI (DUF457 family)
VKKLTHIVVGATAGMLGYHLLQHLGVRLDGRDLLLMAALGGFFGVVPDFDLILGVKYHRSGVSHSLLSAALFSVFIFVGISAVGMDGLAFARTAALTAFLAYLSHLAADAVTDAGVPLFWPVDPEDVSLTDVNSDNVFLNGAVCVLCLLLIAYVSGRR